MSMLVNRRNCVCVFLLEGPGFDYKEWTRRRHMRKKEKGERVRKRKGRREEGERKGGRRDNDIIWSDY